MTEDRIITREISAHHAWQGPESEAPAFCNDGPQLAAMGADIGIPTSGDLISREAAIADDEQYLEEVADGCYGDNGAVRAAAKERLAAIRALPAQGQTAAPADDIVSRQGLLDTCRRCYGRGEIVTDWDGYLNPPAGAPVDYGTTDCPDCDGTGRVATQPAAPDDTDNLRGALVRCREIAVRSEAAPLSMCEIVKRVDMALNEVTPTPEWMGHPPAAPAVKVKPLVWEHDAKFCGQDCSYADTEFGAWTMTAYSGRDGRWAYTDPNGNDSEDDWSSREECEAAAQADYEARILAALEGAQ